MPAISSESKSIKEVYSLLRLVILHSKVTCTGLLFVSLTSWFRVQIASFNSFSNLPLKNK